MSDFEKQARQGDVFIERVESVSPGGEEIPRDGERAILEYGEVTGHAHAIADKGATLYAIPGGKVLQVWEPVALRHEEHSTIKIPPGLFRVTRQREYSPQGLRNVQD